MPETRGADFWSRRRAAVADEERAIEVAEQAEREARAEAERAAALAGKSDADVLQELGLPDPDTLKMGDDFSVFMMKAVPEHLRRRALRRLWVSNPVLANLDGLVEYGDDFTDSALSAPGVKSAYEVGKGIVNTVRKIVAEDPAGAGDAPAVAAAPEDLDETPVAESSLRTVDWQHEHPVEDMDELPAPQPRRHMRFVFEQD